MPDLESVIQSSIDAASSGVAETDPTTQISSEADASDDVASADATTDDATGAPPTTGTQPNEATAAPVARRGPIPYDRHTAVLTKQRKESEARLAELQRQLDELAWAREEGARESITALELAEKNPQLFFDTLVADPRYAAILAARSAPAPVAEPVTPKAPASAERPAPDLDGGYSEQGLQALLDWQSAQTAAQVEAKFQKLFEEKFKDVEPLVNNHKASVVWEEARERQRGVLENARKNWPLFKENEAAIREVLGKKGNERFTLDDAWRAVCVPLMQADRDAMRESILAEIDAAKTAGKQVQPPKAVTEPTPSGPRQLEDVIVTSLRNAGL